MALARFFVELENVKRIPYSEVKGLLGEYIQDKADIPTVKILLEETAGVAFTIDENSDIDSWVTDIDAGANLGDKRDKLDCIIDVLICAERKKMYTTRELLRARFGWAAEVY